MLVPGRAGIALVPVRDMAPAAGTEHLWVADTAQGAADGSSAANAHAKQWFNTAASWSSDTLQDGLIGPGDTVHLCGTLSFAARETGLIIQHSGTAEHPITVLFETGAKLSSPCFEASPGNHTGGAVLIHTKEHIVIDGGTDGVIEATDTGSETQWTYENTGGSGSITGAIGVHLYKANYTTVRNLSVENIYVSDGDMENPVWSGRYGDSGTSSSAVTISASSHVTVSNSTLTAAQIGIQVVLQDTGALELHHNTISQCSAGMMIGISGAGYSGDDVQIHHNEIFDTSAWAYNDGIKVFGVPMTQDPLTDLQIYSNTIGPDISQDGHPATAWILADQGWIIEPAIYNNVLLGNEHDNAANAYITVGGASVAAGLGVLEQNSKIYGNTIVSAYTGTDIAVLVGKSSIGHQLYNNIIRCEGPVSVLYVNDATSAVAACDYNLYYSAASLLSLPQSLNPSFDQHSLVAVDPSLDTAMRPLPTSPAVDAGASLGAGFVSTDKAGVDREIQAPWDIGAYELVTIEVIFSDSFESGTTASWSSVTQ